MTIQYRSRSKKRDLTEAQFLAACKREGFKVRAYSFMGYVDLGIPGHNMQASTWNAGPRRRDQLAYLISSRNHWAARFASDDARKRELEAARVAEADRLDADIEADSDEERAALANE